MEWIWWAGVFGALILTSLAVLVLLGPAVIGDVIVFCRETFSLKAGRRG
jgi:hypothetical protein